jgi:phosphoenolpyruvate-protein phosphotransferase/dihydroxyacetone kinase phosphotransfer subunit
VVGLVVVSHSRALAVAAAALAAEMIRDTPVPIELAAGLDETTLGTDATAIMTAVAAADRGDGVVVLMDLGSAVLSAELALELLEDDLRERVVLCPAPLVEGLVAAAVAAGGGADRAEVAAEALAGLTGKQSHLAPAPTAPNIAPTGSTTSASSGDAGASAGSDDAGASASFAVTNRHGLHARPAARLVTLARSLEAGVEIRNADTGSPWVPATSLARVATLGALRGHHLEIRASGSRAQAAVDQLIALANNKFNETETEAAAAPARSTAGGLPASAGIAIGPAWRLSPAPLTLPDAPSRGPEPEWQRLTEARAPVRRELDHLRTTSDIFEAHLLLLDDPDLLATVRGRIDAGAAAAQAWAAATTDLADQFDALPDDYLRARAADVRAVAQQTLRVLLGVPAGTARGTGVLIAPDLTPAEAAALDPDRVTGVLLAFGSPAAHSAILLRTAGIPAVVAAGPGVLDTADGTPIALDGSTGEVRTAPSGPDLEAWQKRAAEAAGKATRAATRAGAPALTRDGVAVTVAANVGSLADARAAAAGGADLIGLIRTEFLFLDRDTAPDVDEQEAVLRELAEAVGGRRITIRTLDVGGDKPLRFLPAPAERNPFLGVRGIRYALRHPELLADQLLAVVRVARDVPVSLMVPMVSTVDEVRQTRRMLSDAVARSHQPPPAGLRFGIMVEVPAAALKTAAFAPHVDFVSIGTNDLTQYALAAERGNPALAELADGLDPGVLRLIDAVCRGAGPRIPVAVCGELAGDDDAIPVLIGLGVRELSVAPRAVPAVKEAVRSVDAGRMAAAAPATMDLPDAASIRDAVH